MATMSVAPPVSGVLLNDFSLQVATVNGSGSQSSNLVLLRTIFQMGVPISGKNLFPSNIAGLPTWFTIRASRHGYVARKKEIDFLIAMNPETVREDVLGLDPGASVLYDEPLKANDLRHDVTFYPVPFDKLVAGVCPDAKLRKLVRNMIYVGCAAHLMNMEMEEVERALRQQFKKKQKAADLNWGAVKAGFDYAMTNFPQPDRCRLERMAGAQSKTAGKIIIEGNAAAALGCLFAGVTVVAWYPITPSSSLCEYLIEYLKKYRRTSDGKATFAAVQAEDELAACGMVLGAGWMGARAMTSTSGPGISLMSEFVGLGYYAEIPGVIFDIQRVGPSTGLPTRTAQGDLGFVATLGHGDTRQIILLPGSVEECYEMGIAAFDIAERYQTPIFVLSDLDLAMNHWMAEPFAYPTKPLDRGKVLRAEDLTRLKGDWARYRDVDGDGIGYRTLPGTDHPAAAFFTRGSGHNERAQYSEKSADYTNNLDRLKRKWEGAREHIPAPIVERTGAGEVAVIAYGSTHAAMLESLDQLREHKINGGYLRLRAYPFAAAVREFVAGHHRVYVVDQNRDGQMFELLQLDLGPELAARLRSVRHYNGLPVDARSLTDAIVALEGAK
ncbi:MAG TPA: 2-oxoacid:acceptor oxidoreductase subunit alpha [Terriglobales bacterium]|nr:2-oxoacid:acceptor oxidoreductase subunit alpha [Terriglobales bacterium]